MGSGRNRRPSDCCLSSAEGESEKERRWVEEEVGGDCLQDWDWPAHRGKSVGMQFFSAASAEESAVGLVASLAGEQELDIKELAVVLCPMPGGDDVTVASSGQLRRKATQ